MEKQYAKAVMNLLAQGTDEKTIVTRLSAHLASSGRTKLFPGILRELKVLAARKAKLAPTVEAASEKETHAALKEAKQEGIVATKAVVNPTLVKGWRAREGGKLVDRSAKQGLIDLYRKVTN